MSNPTPEQVRHFYKTTTPQIKQQARLLFDGEGEEAAIAYLEILCSQKYFSKTGGFSGSSRSAIEGSDLSLTEKTFIILRQSYPEKLRAKQIADRLGKNSKRVSGCLRDLLKRRAIFKEQTEGIRYPLYCANPEHAFSKISQRERRQRIYELLDEGLTTVDVAAQIGCSRELVSHYRSKGGARSR